MLVMGVWHGLTVHYIFNDSIHGILLAVTEIYQKKSKFYKKYKKKTWVCTGIMGNHIKSGDVWFPDFLRTFYYNLGYPNLYIEEKF